MIKIGNLPGERQTPLRAIHTYCVDCSGKSSKELRLCPCPSCPLHVFRFGRNPYRQKTNLTDEERVRRGEFLRKMRKEAQG